MYHYNRIWHCPSSHSLNGILNFSTRLQWQESCYAQGCDTYSFSRPSSYAVWQRTPVLFYILWTRRHRHMELRTFSGRTGNLANLKTSTPTELVKSTKMHCCMFGVSGCFLGPWVGTLERWGEFPNWNLANVPYDSFLPFLKSQRRK